MKPVWICPECGAPFAAPNASHSCVVVSLDERFVGSLPAVRAAFDRLAELVALATVDGEIPVVAQKTRIVFAAPMRFLAVMVRRKRLDGHILLDRPVPHPVVTAIVPNAYESGLHLHRFSITDAAQLDDAFAAIVREGAARVGRRERLDEGRPEPGHRTGGA
jgi:hypothetical protein